MMMMIRREEQVVIEYALVERVVSNERESSNNTLQIAITGNALTVRGSMREVLFISYPNNIIGNNNNNIV